MGYPRHQRARDFKVFTRTSGNLTINSTTWADLPTIGTTWDAVLTAQTGDVIEVCVTGITGAEAVSSYFDVATIVSAAPVNYFATAGGASGQGIPGAVGQALSNIYFLGIYMRTLVAGDISAGTVTLRLRYRTNTATDRTIFATADVPLQFWAKNLGPQDPN